MEVLPAHTVNFMSESADDVKLFFNRALHCTLHNMLLPDTLQTAEAEDRALPGGNSSADFGAKTRAGVDDNVEPQQNLN